MRRRPVDPNHRSLAAFWKLQNIDFESLNWDQIDPPGAKTSPTDLPTDSEGGLSGI